MGRDTDSDSAPTQGAELEQLIADILTDPGYANGIRTSETRLSARDALGVLREFYAGHDAADAHIPDIARGLGREVACELGCTACCGSLVLISTVEAGLIAYTLLQPGREADLARFRARAADWLERAGSEPKRGADALVARNDRKYLRVLKRHGRRAIMCPLEHDGKCSVYAERPLPCRQVWAADTAEYCMPGPADEPDRPQAELITYRQFEEMVALGRQLTAGMQHVMGDGIRREPLASAVLRLLDE